MVSKFKNIFGKNSAGFTLVEIMVVIAIVGIINAIVIVSFGNLRIQKELETNAREFVSVVREAQNYALSGKQMVSGTTPCGYRVTWMGSGYFLIYMYKAESGLCTEHEPVATYALKNGVQFNTGSDDVSSVYFTPPLGKVFHAGGNPSVKVNFAKSLASYAVCVYDDGKVLETDEEVCP